MSGAPGDETEPAPPVRHRILLPPSYARPAVAVITALVAAVLVFRVHRDERDIATTAPDWPAIAFVAAVALCLSSALTLATKRVLAPIAVSCGVLVLVSILSVVKYRYVRSSLSLRDFHDYATLADLSSLVRIFPQEILVGLATGLMAAGAAWLLFSLDTTRMPRKRAAALLGLAALALASAASWRGERGRIEHFFGGHHVSTPIASVPEAFRHGGLLEAADRGGTIGSEPLAPRNGKSEPPPTIVSILHESAFPTGMFPVQCGGRAPEALYTSSDGNRYELRVETYNGATWMTEYGLLLGLSTYYLGGNRLWAGYTLQDRVRDSLPLQLRRNGYRTVALYPTPKTFVNTGKFYKSIGFDKFLDYYDLHATTELGRDRFYLGKAIAEIRAHKASGASAPLFVFAWTNTTHAPYDYAIHPSVKPDPGAICGKDGSWAEYIRRLLMAEDDLAWFAGRLRAEFPDERFLILGYGDHHPYGTQEFLEPTPSVPFTPVRGSAGYRTFFRITGVNFEPDWSGVPASVDTPFLGNVLMRAGRLPRHGFYNDRDKLMDLCAGRYSDCPRQDEILSFHHRLITSSTIIDR